MTAPSENRGRKLIYLGGATLLLAALAGVAIYQRAGDTAPTFQAQPVVPGLNDTINNIGEVAIETRDGSFHARRTEDGNWVIPERNNFPANVQMVRSASVGMAELEAIEQRTAQPELFERLGLVAPEDGGAATRVVLRNREGDVMGDILVGNTQGINDPQGLGRFYVRRTGENQTWLARGSMTVQRDPAAWLDKNILSIERDRIRSATYTPVEGPAFTLARPTVEEAEYQLEALPAGRELSYPGVTYGAATAISNFTFDDVRVMTEIDFEDATQAVFETFDGLQITLRIAEDGGAHWASLMAASTGDAERQMEADSINIAAHGWAFEVPEFTAQTFQTSRDSLLAPAGE